VSSGAPTLRLRAAVRPVTGPRLAVRSVLAFFGTVAALGVLHERLSGESIQPVTLAAASPADLLLAGALFLAVLAGVVLAHEFVHGAFMRRYGARPTFGIGTDGLLFPYAYARSDGTLYARDAMIAIALAPCLLLSLAGALALVAFRDPLWILPVAANVAGSVGDLRLASVLLGQPSDVRVGPLPDGPGVGIYGPAGATVTGSAKRVTVTGSASRIDDASAGSDGRSDEEADRTDGPSAGRVLGAFVDGAAATLSALVAVSLLWVIASLAVGDGAVLIGHPERRWFLLRHDVAVSSYAASVEVGTATAATLSTAGGLAWTAVVLVRRSLAAEP